MTKKLKIICIALAIVLIVGGTAYAATNYGSESDPLITKSYLDETLTPQIMSQVQSQASSAANGRFSSVTIYSGQVLELGAGGEVMLRSGSAACTGTLIDTTGGYELPFGSPIDQNHLLVAAEASGVTAVSDGAMLLVSGSYTLK